MTSQLRTLLARTAAGEAEYTEVLPSGAARAARRAPSLAATPLWFSTSRFFLGTSGRASATMRTVLQGECQALKRGDIELGVEAMLPWRGWRRHRWWSKSATPPRS